ncbi:hypothetical protein KUCAC02_028846 [Chaenocephalus aceratus]|uniref:Uncharacterized protein n=1 Tax=Chaenocephalus aceratus TaxID=36190 RepID=A0ACB9X341_CHAAC|nr:hypothetical protein KUCAC02_028846 [Chaenocephalus aceratus]
MGIQRAGYQTVQSAGKIQNVPLAHLELAVAAEGESEAKNRDMAEAVMGQVSGEDAKPSGQQVTERAAVTSC